MSSSPRCEMAACKLGAGHRGPHFAPAEPPDPMAAGRVELARLRAVLDVGQEHVEAVAADLPSGVLATPRLAVWAVITALRARAGIA